MFCQHIANSGNLLLPLATFGKLCQLLEIIDLLSGTLQFLAMFGNLFIYFGNL